MSKIIHTPFLLIETPRAGKWNHRHVVASDVPKQTYQAYEAIIENIRKQPVGANFLAVGHQRLVKQKTTDRMAPELLILAGIDTNRLNEGEKKELREKLQSLLEQEVDGLINETINWDEEGEKNPLARKELSTWLRGFPKQIELFPYSPPPVSSKTIMITTTAIGVALFFLVTVSTGLIDNPIRWISDFIPRNDNSSEQKAECGISITDKERYFERFDREGEGWQELIKKDGSCRDGISGLIADIITSGNSITLSRVMRGFDDELSKKNMSDFLGVADQIVQVQVQNNKLIELLECRKKIISFQNEEGHSVFNPLIIKGEVDQLREAIKNYFGKPYRNGYAYSDVYKIGDQISGACREHLSKNAEASNELELLKKCRREDNYASLVEIGKAHPEFWEETQKFWEKARDLINQCDLSK